MGGVRNWDHRFCWPRDSTYTLYALFLAGYPTRRGVAGWLLRAAAAGHRICRPLWFAGERRLAELEFLGSRLAAGPCASAMAQPRNDS